MHLRYVSWNSCVRSFGGPSPESPIRGGDVGNRLEDGPHPELQWIPGHVPFVQVVGSLFIPSPTLLTRMRARPWNGVFLSEEYLSSVPTADRITREIVALYERHGVEPLVESAVTSDEDFQRVRDLLGPLADAGAGPTHGLWCWCWCWCWRLSANRRHVWSEGSIPPCPSIPCDEIA